MTIFKQSHRRRQILRQAEIIIIFIALLAALAWNFSLNSGKPYGMTVSFEHSDGGIALKARSACLYHPASGEFLYEAAAEERLAPASTVKLLTALTAIDYCSMEELVTVGEEVARVPADASRAWLYAGDILSVRQLLYAMLLPSGNDAAYTLAVFCGRRIADNKNISAEQAIDTFVLAMNDKAEALGAVNSCFLNPDGYDKSGQYSTAHDLSLIAEQFCGNELLLEIAGCFESRELWANGREAIYYNTNDLLNTDSPFYYEAAVGLKTGTSSDAGACLAAAAIIDGELYIAVVLGSRENDRYRDCLTLFEQIASAS